VLRAERNVLKTVNVLARALGVLSGAALSGAWAFALWVPTAGLTLSGVSFVVALLLMLLALFATIASFYGHAVVVVLAFLASFFPVGAFLMPTEHWLRWTGWLDLALLAAGLLMWLTRRAALERAAPARPSP
jgi:hypothetical protein